MTDRVDFSAESPDVHRPYVADAGRYTNFSYRRVGTSGLLLPPISLGLWYNFGDNRPFDGQREILRRAFDRGVTHFDLANNYGPPPGSAEENFGRMLRGDFRPYRSELIVSTKAGWEQWPGPYGNFGSRKYLLNSLDKSLERLSTDYVDIFYSHRFAEGDSVEEIVSALDLIVRQGKALYVGISSYSPARTREAHAIAKELGTPLVIHQPAYSMLNRWVEPELLPTLSELGMGSIVFTPLAQGLLTDKFLEDRDAAHATTRPSFRRERLNDDMLRRLRALNEIAQRRGQSLAQLALAWLLHDGRITSALIGASSVKQLDENLDALNNMGLSPEELDEIDTYALDDRGIDIWAQSAQL